MSIVVIYFSKNFYSRICAAFKEHRLTLSQDLYLVLNWKFCNIVIFENNDIAKLLFYSNLFDMSQDNLIQLKNKETGEVYYSRKNRKNTQEKLELKKYSKKLRKQVVFKEAKK